MLLLISGSLRKESFNTKLLNEAARYYEADSTQFADLNLPLYNGDDEAEKGIPDSVQKLSEQIQSSDAIIIASPEYNQGISGVLKNALDWVSRTEGAVWRGKPVALLHATAGRTGGARANYALRLVMAPFGCDLVQSPEVLIASAYSEFDENGQLKNERYQSALKEAMQALKAKASL